MGTLIVFLTSDSSFAVCLDTNHGFLSYLCGELSASSSLLLCRKEGKKQGGEQEAAVPLSLLLGWRADEPCLVMSTWENQNANCLLGYPF